MTIRHGDAVALLSSFSPTPEEEKSLELVLPLLGHSATPFSRDHFTPGHITATALVFHPDRNRVLLIHHHRLQRWLLPGGANRRAVRHLKLRKLAVCQARLLIEPQPQGVVGPESTTVAVFEAMEPED